MRLMTHASVLLIVGLGGVAAAKPAKRHWHAHRAHAQTRLAIWAPAAPVQPSRLGPMRYYGGPKSPMWRAPAEN